MPKQLITINPDGSIEGLQVKKGRGVDLRQFGTANIERITNIEWAAEEQKWFIRFLLGELAGCLASANVVRATAGYIENLPCPNPNLTAPVNGTPGTLLWDDYDDAVKAEIAIIQAARKAGRGHLVGAAS